MAKDFAEAMGYKRVGPSDTFLYQCIRCGDCCHNVRDAIMLSTLDLFRIAKYENRQIEEVILAYTDVVPIGEYKIPILMLKTKQYGDVCILYKKTGCTIQKAKPQVCRLYPLSAGPDDKGGLEYFIVSKKPHHYTGTTWRVGDWMQENMTSDDVRFQLLWYRNATDLGKLIRQHEGTVTNAQLIRIGERVVWYLYFAYNIDEDFWSQYERNMDLLKREITSLSDKSHSRM